MIGRADGQHPFMGRRYHFSGVGGSGMTPLAILSASWGAQVTGSDRNWDRGLDLPSFRALRAAGVQFVPQDGTGITEGLDAVIHSTAIEQGNPEYTRAVSLGIPRIRRGTFLASITASRRTIAVAGTSGKSTVTAMVAHILLEAGLDPSFVGGGAAVSLPGAVPPGSLRVGSSDWLVVETDESDGSVAEISSAIAVLTNLSRDHKEIEETIRLFESFLEKARECVVIHAGDPVLGRVQVPESLPRLHVALEGSEVWATPDLVARSIRLDPESVAFEVDEVSVRVPVPGRLTVENALLALGAAESAGIPRSAAADALATFAGVRRRLERIGTAGGLDVFDDFAHNPVKIAAALEALRPRGSFWIVYQPHGYGPTRFFRDELIATFAECLRPGDHLFLSPIYDAGGTADRSIRSEDLIDPLRRAGVDAAHAATREEAIQEIAKQARPGDRVVVMGARDDTLPGFARRILEAVEERVIRTAPSPQGRR